MLCAHWDSRPYADQDEKSNHQKPIDGANDDDDFSEFLVFRMVFLSHLIPEDAVL